MNMPKLAIDTKMIQEITLRAIAILKSRFPDKSSKKTRHHLKFPYVTLRMYFTSIYINTMTNPP